MRISLVLAGLLLASSAAAQERPEPPVDNGTAWLVSGGILTALSVPAFAAIKPCLSMQDTRTKMQLAADDPVAPGTGCVWTAASVGIGLVTIGVPLLTVGLVKRASWLRGIEIAPTRTGAAISWTATF